MFSPASRRISHIYNHCYKQRADQKCLQMIRAAEAMMRVFGVNDECYDWFISPFKIQKCVESYYLDVIKYKEFHFNPINEDCDVTSPDFINSVHEKLVNESKAAAFSVKWILKSMPIYVLAKKTLSKDESMLLDMVNEIFAFRYAVRLMDIDPNKIDDTDTRDILYHLKYRNYDDRNLMLIFSLLKKQFDPPGPPACLAA